MSLNLQPQHRKPEMTCNNVTVIDSRRIVLLAQEGVPVKAIARGLVIPSEVVYGVLKDALCRGEIAAPPPSDWPLTRKRMPHSPVAALAERAAARLAERPAGPDRWVMPLQRAFRLTPSEARAVALLLEHREVSKETLHAFCSTAQDLKVVDVAICKARKKLAPYGIEITTLWWRGYAITKANADLILAALNEIEPQELPKEIAA